MVELASVVLRDPSSPLTATYVPSAGMICTSLAEAGVEYLGQRRGLAAYLSDAKTMGIPILYPWANRLSANGYGVDGGSVTLTAGVGGVHSENHGLPIHGVLSAYPGWAVTEQSENRLTAELDFGSKPGLLASFPFPHVLTLDVTLADRTLAVTTTVAATTEVSVPLCYGFHPYFVLPGVPRSEWVLQTPRLRHLSVDERGIPTGLTDEWPAYSDKLGDKTFDDGFDEVPPGAVFTLTGGDRHIDVVYDQGYPAAQIYAPASDDLVAIEPMTAPTNALRAGGYRAADPGRPDVSVFTVRVS
ncbi:galactose mutarotase-like enzyme [Mycolicibacterium sp. BK556]|uniref:aldose 1-epimerase n=1 Tax=unclassified Mycolicibacterium TaxID=2636767 RepID=UPI00160B92E6|nr:MULTISPECIES: aldose 1-epimerase [unclassified Mycolicibacterium]MBB3604943.1 galactose mutarotase-like enzyme [Mycolicibacterium sp. BK556]MBB3635139.1 galactose mutarotase-like enzyme [Mycolicibacterium sp. BK607]